MNEGKPELGGGAGRTKARGAAASGLSEEGDSATRAGAAQPKEDQDAGAIPIGLPVDPQTFERLKRAAEEAEEEEGGEQPPQTDKA